MNSKYSYICILRNVYVNVSGIEPMGLLWSMTPSKDKGAKRLLIKDVTRPYDVTMSVHADHVDLEAIKSANNISSVLDTKHVRRWYLRNGVQRIPVRKGRLRGTLFIPSGILNLQ